jgi:hypothetical protein
MPEKCRINVSAKIIADISSGIYRTPANALKELVSNAFDAGAESAIITTDYPDFNVMTCTDYGAGMTKDKFKEIMDRIGGSDKRARENPFAKFNRPLIGKIGIGLLAVAQICHKFTIISSTVKDKMQFQAEIDLKPFHQQDAYKYNLRDSRVEIGDYEIFEMEKEEPNKSYTRIILQEIDEGFRDRLIDVAIQAVYNFQLEKGDPQTFEEFVSWLKDKKLKDIPEYLKLLWELAIISPIPYFKDGPVPDSKTMTEVKNRLNNYNFEVIVDGIKLSKPILLPYEIDVKDKHFNCKTYDISFDEIIGLSRLKFAGYIYHQNHAISPPELRGIIVRIRNVGIGSYDKSFLNFPQSVGPIITGMTGEIYVEAGLEDALNIDRNSFRETDPHFLKLQEIIFSRLSASKENEGILSDARSRSRIVQEDKRDDYSKEEIKALASLVSKVYGKYFEIKRVNKYYEYPVKIDFENLQITLFNLNPILPRKSLERNWYEEVSVFHELSTYNNPNKDAMDKMFYAFLKQRRSIQ